MLVEDPSDPRRCKRVYKTGQCNHYAQPGSDFCERCVKHSEQAKIERSQYLFTKAEYRRRVSELSNHDEMKSLRDEIAVARMLIEERLNNVSDKNDLLAACGPLNQLLLTVERLVKSAHVLEQNLGELLSRDTVAQLGAQLADTLNDVLEEKDVSGREEVMEEVLTRFATLLSGAENEQPARGLKLLSSPNQ